MQSKSFIQSSIYDDHLSTLFSPGNCLSYSVSPKMFTSPSVFLNPPQAIIKAEQLSAEKNGPTHHRISGNSQVKVMTPLSSIGLMGPPENPPLKSGEQQQQLTNLDPANPGNLVLSSFEHSSPASSSSSSSTNGGYYFDYALNSQPNNTFTSTPVIMSKSLQCQSQVSDGKTVSTVLGGYSSSATYFLADFRFSSTELPFSEMCIDLTLTQHPPKLTRN